MRLLARALLLASVLGNAQGLPFPGVVVTASAPVTLISQLSGTSAAPIGSVSTYQRCAQSFTLAQSAHVTSITLNLAVVGAPLETCCRDLQRLFDHQT